MFTFCKQRKLGGLASIASPLPATTMKHKGRPVGEIVYGSDSHWAVILTLERDGKRMPMRLVKRFATEPEARDYMRRHAEAYVAMGLWYD